MSTPADVSTQANPLYVAGNFDQLEERAYALILDHGVDEEEHFPILEAAWPMIAAALPLFLSGDNERLQEICYGLSGFLHFSGRWEEQIALSTNAESRAVAAGDLHDAGWRAHDAGSVHYLRGEADAVLACAARALVHWQSAPAGPSECAFAFQLRGCGQELKCDFQAAIADHREALKLWRCSATESDDVARALNFLAAAEQLADDIEAATSSYCKALRMARAVGDSESLIEASGGLANLALLRKDWKEAEALVREFMPLCITMGREEPIALECRRLAEALVRQGKAEEAESYARRAVEIFAKLSSPDLEDAQAILAECEAALPPS